MCNCAKFIAIEQQSEGICCCSSPLPPLPPPLLLCSSRTVNKNRLHVKLCLASVKRSSTIDSNRPEHDVASVPPPAPTTSLPSPLTLPSWCCNFACPLATPFGWLCLRLRFLFGLPPFIYFWHFYYYFFTFYTFFSLLCFLDAVVSSCGRH